MKMWQIPEFSAYKYNNSLRHAIMDGILILILISKNILRQMNILLGTHETRTMVVDKLYSLPFPQKI